MITKSNYNLVKKTLQHLAFLCKEYGLEHIVLSPGSRSAPVAMAFYNQEGIQCYIVNDERSACYFALGIAQVVEKPVGIVCTSGTAALNLTPAMAEGWHQNICLLAITADRPAAWVGHNDGQTIDQNGIFHNFVCFENNLPEKIDSYTEIWHFENIIKQCFFQMSRGQKPAHLNVPISEPLYSTENDTNSDLIPNILKFPKKNKLQIESTIIKNMVKNDSKIMIIIGMNRPDSEFQHKILHLALQKKVVILAENLSNCNFTGVFQEYEPFFSKLSEFENEQLSPEILITFGNMHLSKSIKRWIRANKKIKHYLITENLEIPDVFQNITEVMNLDKVSFVNALSNEISVVQDLYYKQWDNIYNNSNNDKKVIIDQLEWCDIRAFQIISKHIPDQSYLQLGNSTPVRYAQLIKWSDGIQFYANRGTAGIDGCLSTAMGMSTQTEKIVTIIIGDNSFLYDSNALWNKLKPENLRIIVINNQGGNIFGLIPGPDQTNIFEEYFVSNVEVSIQHLAKAYGIDYLPARNESQLIENIQYFYSMKKCCILEIFTNLEVNIRVWKQFINNHK